MKTVPAELEACGTLVFAVIVVRKDGTVLAYTQHDRNQTVMVGASPVQLLANPGFNLSSIVSTAGLGVDNAEITLFASDDITRTDILARKWDGASVYFFRYSWRSPLAGVIPVKRGSFGAFTPKLGQFVVEFRDIRQALQTNSTWVFQESCRWRLGDARCGVDLAEWTHSAVVTAVASQRVFTAAALGQDDDYFGEGEVVFEVGINAGQRFKVSAFAGGVITLSEAAVLPIEVGDEITVIAGCRKRWDVDCRDKFDALLSFGGEKDKPTRDELIAPPPAVPA